MYDIWREETARIRTATGCRIDVEQVALTSWPAVRQQFEEKGGEVLRWQIERDRVIYVGIYTAEWSASARALLSLLVSAPLEEPSLALQLTNWLIASQEEPLPLPAKLESRLAWKERRALFLLQRTSEPQADWTGILPLLASFFSDPKQQQCLYLPVSERDLFLLVPFSLFPDIDLDRSAQETEQALLEWAAGIHELFAVEALEEMRVIVNSPLNRVHELAEHAKGLTALASALARFRPRVLVAGAWQFSLEKWFGSLPVSLSGSFQRAFSERFPQSLSSEQCETLDALFTNNLNISEAARSLFLHRNTLLYRLDKIKEQTGLDPRLFSDALLLRLAVLFQQA
ncbi:UNVERIFIED_CONTAM: hypothetical protein ABID98_002616 [Brevibacillus sp. OAP136]